MLFRSKNARGIRDSVRRNVEDALASAIVFNQDIVINSFSLTAKNEIEVKIN